MARSSLVSLCGLICVVHLGGIEGTGRKRLFRGPKVAALYDKNANIMGDFHTENAMACAAHCLEHGCAAFLFRGPGTQQPDNHCFTSSNLRGYSRYLSTTVNGRTCQRWDRQNPHNHNMNANQMAEATLTEANNYCRAIADYPYPWCYTTESCCRWEHCNVIKCMGSENNCRLYSVSANPALEQMNGYKYYSGV